MSKAKSGTITWLECRSRVSLRVRRLQTQPADLSCILWNARVQIPLLRGVLLAKSLSPRHCTSPLLHDARTNGHNPVIGIAVNMRPR
jgi:hypothetical protein